MQKKSPLKFIKRQLIALAVIVAIFGLSKMIPYWAVQVTTDAKIVNNNYFRSNRFTLRYAQAQASLNLPTDPSIHQVTLMAYATDPPPHPDRPDVKPPAEATLAAAINGDPLTTTYHQLTGEASTIVLESAAPITSLSFYIPNHRGDFPWALQYITTDRAHFTNLLNFLPFDQEAGWQHFEDVNRNPALSLSQYLTQWDSIYYLQIAENGYSYDGNYLNRQNIAWPYLFPLLIRTAHDFLPTRTFSSLAVALNLGFSFGSLILLYLLTRHFIRPFYYRFIPLVLFACSPFSVFLTTIHTESLFIMLLLAFLLCLMKNWRLPAAVFLCLMGATRITGLPLIALLWLPLFFPPTKTLPATKIKTILTNTAFTVVACLGFGSFLWHIHTQFGTPWLDPMKIQQAWDYNVPGQASLWKFFANIATAFTWNKFTDFIANPYYSGLYLNLGCVAISTILLIKSLAFSRRPFKIKVVHLDSLYLATASLLLLAANFQTLLYQQNYTIGRLGLPALALTGVSLAHLTQKKPERYFLPLVIYLVFASVLALWYAICVINGELPC